MPAINSHFSNFANGGNLVAGDIVVGLRTGVNTKFTFTGGGGGGGVTEVDTGLGLQGGPIVNTGTISFADMNANSFWGNITGALAAPTQVSTSYFVKTTQIGVTVEAWSPALDSIASLTTSANQIPYLTASNTYSVMAAAANSVLITSAGSIPSLSTTLPTTVQGNITQLGVQSQALNMNSHRINNVTDPASPQDAATMAYVLAQTTGAFLKLDGTSTMAGQIDMGNHKIVNLTDPSASQDAVTLSYLATALNAYLLKSGGTMTGAINMGSHFITNLLDPVNPQDAATKNYADSIAAGLTIQPAVYAATTANLTALYANGAAGIGATLTNTGALAAFSVDGVSPPVNSRILVKDRASTLENGIFILSVVGSGAVAWILTRATDYDQPAEIQPGDLVIVNNGTANGGASFVETASVGVIGVDPILFSQFTFSATAVLLKANNLSDVASTVTSFNNISPSTTKGDLIVNDGTNDVRLAVGMTDGQILQVSSGAATGLAYSTATYPATTTVNQILYSSSTNVIGGISTLAGGVMVTDASSVPQFLTNPAVAGKMLQSANAAIPAWSTPTWPSASGTAGKFIISDGTNNIYSTPTIPNSAGSANHLLLSDGTNYVLSVPSFPNASATVNKIIKSDGTNWVASTETYAAPGTIGNVLTSDGTNWISAAPEAGSILTTKGDILGFNTTEARIPVATGDGKVLQVDSSNALGVSYSTPTYPSTSGTTGKFLISDGTNNVYSTSTIPTSAGATANKLLLSDGTNYVLSTPTFPNASATTRKMMVSDGTNWVASTETWAVPGSTGNVLTSDGTNWTSSSTAAAGRLIGTQVFLVDGTYTPTSGCNTAVVYAVGGGGGGGSTGSASRNTGTSGSDTTLATTTVVAKGGTGGNQNGIGGAGGVAGTGNMVALPGNGGETGYLYSATLNSSGRGAGSVYGGQPIGAGGNATGTSAVANTGAGGSGGGQGSSAANTPFSGAGGGSGGYCVHKITSVTGTYAVDIGAGGGGGSAGTNGFAGGSGGSGIIVIFEYS